MSPAKLNHIDMTAIKTAIFAILFASCSVVWVPAAVADSEAPGLVKQIYEESEGEVTIEIPAELLEKIMLNPETPKKTGNESQHNTGNRAGGYRIQVFSDGRNQHSLEARAKARGSAIIARFPKYRGQVYTQSSSPNWYTRIGNFRSQQEANAALEELRRAFPQYSSEMRVVKSKIIAQ